VGDAACARCHAEIASTYRQHPMGRSLAPITPATAAGGDGSNGASFEAQGFRYEVEDRGGRVVHRETRRDSRGRVIARNEAEVRYAIGSGSRGTSYLIDRDGSLFQSPITWYPQEGRWDLSPGYQGRNFHFDRPIRADCLFCHANHVEPVEGTLNRYRPPLFRGHAIGCERCHGPGERHVRRPGLVDGLDPTIVNPGRLEPSLREAVCQQCHLQGALRIERAGRQVFDYRPGLPLHEFWSVFVWSEGLAESNRNVSHVEQMHASRCYRASRGRLGCISCHDPHRLPAPDEEVAYYRARCLECHDPQGCTLSEATRRRRSPADSCIECHMPRAATSNVAHVATTLHRIPRHADRQEPSPVDPRTPRPDEPPLVHFHRDLIDARGRAEVERDLGVAMIHKAGPGPGTIGPKRALPLLEAALSARPDDVPAREAMGFALGMLGRREEGLKAFRAALARAPDREGSLVGAASLAAQLGRLEEAIASWRRAIAINPWYSDYHARLALVHARARDWPAAMAAGREALRLNPAHIEARKVLVRGLLRTGDAPGARAAFETLLELAPDDRGALLRWLADQL
jgi:tetratricopeptide (TPR) repeat protein